MSTPITIDADIQAGTPCFTGTRVPIKSLFDALRHGRNITYFLDQFPTVSPSQVDELLAQVEQTITKKN